jgi:hypothetical protein
MSADTDEASLPGTHRHLGQQPVPRRHDVRRLRDQGPPGKHLRHTLRSRRGHQFIDTADVYSGGESECIVGKALAGGKRDHVVLATKVAFPMADDPNQLGNSRRWIITEVESQQKLDAVEQLAQLAGDAGMTLIETDIAIIGPRTMEHLESQLRAAEIRLSGDVLDRMDEINPPRVTMNFADNHWTGPALEPGTDAREKLPEAGLQRLSLQRPTSDRP